MKRKQRNLRFINECHQKYFELVVTGKNPQHICGALHDLVPFVQFKKHEKHPWRSVNFSTVAG